MGGSRRPNILFLFADQMRGQDMRCAGNEDMFTPAMDRMAAEGVMCERHYVTSPLCSPNRATMLTGTHPTTHRLLFNDWPVRTDLASLGTLARANGYRTGYIGKWHIDGGPRERFIPPGPRRLGFDHFWAVLNCGHDYFDARYHRDTPEMIRRPGYEPEVQTQLALEFLDACAGCSEPFCLVVSWGPPHNPYEQVPEKYRALYELERLRLRPNCRPIPREVLDPAWSHRPTTRDYYAQISSLDDMLGRLLERLDSMGIDQDTIVVFTSDHGDMMWSQGLLYKCVPFEECILVPLLVRYPRGLPAGYRCRTLIGSVDLLPTVCSLAGWDVPESFDGLDLSAALRGKRGATEPDSVFIAQYSPYVFRQDFPVPEWRGIRAERYTYAARSDRSPWLLFDNYNDPYQLINLAEEPSHRQVVRELGKRLEKWLERVGDPFLSANEMSKRFSLPQHPEPSV